MKLLDVVILGILILWGIKACYSIYKQKGCNGCGGCEGCNKKCTKKNI